jgi:hypothetical protein
MKSWRRTSNSFIEYHHTIHNRCSDLVRHLARTDEHDEALLTELNANGRRYKACLSVLIVATPEYLDPNQGTLWCGEQITEPRVVTGEELTTFSTINSVGTKSSRGQLDMFLKSNRTLPKVVVQVSDSRLVSIN